MSADVSSASRADLLLSIQQLAATGRLLPHREMHDLLKDIRSEEMLFRPTEWTEIVDFATDQLSRWQVEWLFSPAETPDSIAASESEGWRVLWRTYADALVKAVPGVEIDEMCELRQLSELLQRSLEYRRKQPLTVRLTLGTFFALGKIIARLGVGIIGRGLVRRGMYPPKTVGRAVG